jgi:glycosyltransferase involved in cell wall biosynthesis
MGVSESIPRSSGANAMPDLAFVYPLRQGALPLYWNRVLLALGERNVSAQVIPGAMRRLGNIPWPRLSRRIFVPSVRFVRALLRSPAPVVFCIEYSLGTLASAVVARVRRKHVVIFQEGYGLEDLPLTSWDRRYRRILIRLAHGVVANTDAAYDELANVVGVDRRKLFRATLLVAPERAVLSQGPALELRPTSRPLFLYVGQLIRRKNVCILIDAARALRARGLTFEIWIAGDGPERRELEVRAGALINDGVVRFLGPWAQTAVGALYEIADVFVMPSLRDHRSVAVLEALRFGKPVIDSARDGNARDLVRHGVTGFVFDPLQPASLEAVMAHSINAPGTLHEMARRISELMAKHTPQTAAAALSGIVEAVSNGKTVVPNSGPFAN